MGKIFIVCPKCHQRLSLNEVPDYLSKIAECPKCHFRATISVFQGGGLSRESNQSEDLSTQLVMPPSAVQPVGQIRVKSTGLVHTLKPGSNIIGRIAESGDADIKIARDEYMSRRHVQIDVVKKNIGFEHHLVEINSKNIVKLNGKPIHRGDIIVLKFGDCLTLGKTDIILEPNDDESTRIITP